MGPSLMAVESWASEEVKSIYRQSVELSEKKNDRTQLFASLRGLWGNLFLTGDLKKAIKISRKLDRIAEGYQTDELKIESLLSQAMQTFWQGEFSQSQAYINQVTSLYDQNLHREHAYIFSVDPGVVSLFYASRNLMYLGYPDDSLKQVEASIKLAEKHQHFPSLTWGLGFHAAVHFAREEFAHSLEISSRSIALSEEHNFQLWAAWGYVLSGCSKIFIKENDHGLEQIKHGIGVYRKLGAGVALPFFYSLYAESLLKLERFNHCLEIAGKGIEMVDSYSINSSAAELLLLKSRALYAKSGQHSDQAMKISRQALSIAQKQRARYTMLKILTAQSQMGDVNDPELMRALKQTCGHFTQGQNLGMLARARDILKFGDS
jgi:tetratricopeptide (TPR) repeat protein